MTTRLIAMTKRRCAWVWDDNLSVWFCFV